MQTATFLFLFVLNQHPATDPAGRLRGNWTLLPDKIVRGPRLNILHLKKNGRGYIVDGKKYYNRITPVRWRADNSRIAFIYPKYANLQIAGRYRIVRSLKAARTIQRNEGKQHNRILIHTRPVKLRDRYGRKPSYLTAALGKNFKRSRLLTEASENGQYDKVAALLNSGVPVNIFGNSLSTPLIMAARNGHFKIVKLLLDRGADPDVQDFHYYKNRTALLWAVFKRHEKIAALLIESGANLNIQERRKKRTALLMASRKGLTATVKLLVSKGADINLPDRKGNSPLIIAIEKGNYKIASFLIIHGAKRNLKNAYGETALSIAEDKKAPTSLLRILKEEQQ